jgi:hypothetical protein
MIKNIYVINGYSNSGKDEFINMYSDISGKNVINLSSAQPVKVLLEPLCGACREYDDRIMISNIKDYLDDQLMYTLRYLSSIIMDYMESGKEIVLFIHIREENIITMLAGLFPLKTILITNDYVEPLTDKDKDIGKLILYDYEISNNPLTKEALYITVTNFLKKEDDVS